MALDKVLKIYDENGNDVDYDILAKDVKLLPDGKDLPTKLSEMEQEIEQAASGGYAPPDGGIPATDLSPAVQDVLNDVANKVDKVPGKGLSTEDFTAALKAKLEALDPYTKAQVDAAIQQAVAQIPQVNLDNYYNKQQVDNAISDMEATIEQQQLTVITGGKLSLWLDEDGESINIIAGDVPDIAATPTITSELISNDPSSADNGRVRVTIATTEQGATIYYTTDGTAPTQSSSVYSSPIVLDTVGQHTIKAIAIVADKLPSSVATAQVTVSACSTPTIEVNNTDRVNAVVTASAGSNESVSLTVGSQTATGTGSASVTIAKTSSPQSLSASASATAAGKLPASATQSVTVDAKESFAFGAHEIGGKAASANEPITLVVKNGVTAGDFVTVPVSFDEEDGEVFWHADLEGKLFSNTLQGKTENNSSVSIFSEGATNVLSIEHIPIEVTVIMANAFQGATACTLFKATATGQSLTTLNGAIKKLTSVVNVYLPPTVTSANNDFNGLTTLQSVSAPGVTTVDGAFGSCTGLTSVVLGQLTMIKSNAFFGCENLVFTGVDFTAVTSIASGGLQKCKKLGSITLNAINSIASNAFAYFSSTALEIIITKPISSASDVPTLNSAAFTSTTNYVVKVPSQYLQYYQAASVWSDLYNNGKLVAITE